jgi:hypothetical protein
MTVRYPLVLNGSTVQELQEGDSLAGTAETSDKLRVSGVDRSASVTSLANTIPVRDASADIFANVFQGVALSSKYADVAEKYIGDVEYGEGTVVVFGGEEEITVTTTYADTRVAGAISFYPGYIMNSQSEGQSVALRGKVPVKVTGIVKKGDLLVTSEIAGFAIVATGEFSANAVFAKSLENKDDAEPGTVVAVIL